jgi:hypothetical protein
MRRTLKVSLVLVLLVFAPVGCGGHKDFTPESFATITPGMPEAKVVEVLGKPAEILEAGDVRRLFWDTKGSYYSISFEDGKVVEPLAHGSKEDYLLMKGLMQAAKETAVGQSPDKMRKKMAAKRLAGGADLSLTADALAKEKNENEKATKEKYKGKVIELTGSVSRISKDIASDPFLSLRVKDTNVPLSIWTVERKPWDKVLPGQGVKLNVIFDESGGIGDLLGGPIREVTGTPNPSITAEELVKAYEADETAADKKYGSSNAGNLIVTGEIIEAKPTNSEGVPEFFLKTGSQLKLSCGPDSESARGLVRGMKVKLLGSSFGFEFGKPKEAVRLVDCLVLEAKK